jgi:hypothetical protein
VEGLVFGRGLLLLALLLAIASSIATKVTIAASSVGGELAGAVSDLK